MFSNQGVSDAYIENRQNQKIGKKISSLVVVFFVPWMVFLILFLLGLADGYVHGVDMRNGGATGFLMAWIFGRKKGDKRQNLYEQAFIHNAGCDWVKRYYRASEHLPLLETLPFILEVEGQFQMVHAEMLDAMSGEVAPDSREDAMADHHFICGFDAYGDWLDHLLWGRSIRWKHRINQPLNPLSAPDLPTYCGHTIFKEVQTLAGHTFLDLGAYATGKLTVMEVL